MFNASPIGSSGGLLVPGRPATWTRARGGQGAGEGVPRRRRRPTGLNVNPPHPRNGGADVPGAPPRGRPPACGNQRDVWAAGGRSRAPPLVDALQDPGQGDPCALQPLDRPCEGLQVGQALQVQQRVVGLCVA
jgi:hypothetical protein